MKTTMTSRQRILAACAHQPTDHVPLHLDVHPLYYQQEPAVAVWTDQFERIDRLLALGADAMVEIWLPDPTLHPEVRVRSWREERDGMVLLGKEYETPAGTLRHVIRETPDLYRWNKINGRTRGPVVRLIDGLDLLQDVNPSRCVEFPVNGVQDLPKLRYLFQPNRGEALARWRADALYARREAERRRVALIARRTFCGSAWMWLTDVQESMLTYESQPEYVSEFLNIIQAWQKTNLEQVLDIGVDIVTRFGYYDTPDFWGRRYFERYLKPLMDEEAAIVHQAGALLSQQQSEGLTRLVDVYRTMKVDILRDVDPVQGGEDLAVLKRELGASKTLMGGINGDLFLAKASADEIDDWVRRLLELVSPGGGFIGHVTPGIYPGVPWKNVLSLVSAWQKYA